MKKILKTINKFVGVTGIVSLFSLALFSSLNHTKNKIIETVAADSNVIGSDTFSVSNVGYTSTNSYDVIVNSTLSYNIYVSSDGYFSISWNISSLSGTYTKNNVTTNYAVTMSSNVVSSSPVRLSELPSTLYLELEQIRRDNVVSGNGFIRVRFRFDGVHNINEPSSTSYSYVGECTFSSDSNTINAIRGGNIGIVFYNGTLDLDVYNLGYTDGYTAGYNNGLSDGYTIGYENGTNDGYATGYQSGTNDGYASGYEVGYQAGVDSQAQVIVDSYNNGYTVGYNEGFSADSTVVSIFSGILQVAMVPVNFFLAIFNFDILGINLSGFIRALFTIAITIIVVRTIFGGKGASE